MNRHGTCDRVRCPIKFNHIHCRAKLATGKTGKTCGIASSKSPCQKCVWAGRGDGVGEEEMLKLEEEETEF